MEYGHNTIFFKIVQVFLSIAISSVIIKGFVLFFLIFSTSYVKVSYASNMRYKICLPNSEMPPQTDQRTRLRPTEPVPFITPVGEIKIPDPEIQTSI